MGEVFVSPVIRSCSVWSRPAPGMSWGAPFSSSWSRSDGVVGSWSFPTSYSYGENGLWSYWVTSVRSDPARNYLTGKRRACEWGR